MRTIQVKQILSIALKVGPRLFKLWCYFEKKYGIIYHKLHLNTNSMVKIALKLLTKFNLAVSSYKRINLQT